MNKEKKEVVTFKSKLKATFNRKELLKFEHDVTKRRRIILNIFLCVFVRCIFLVESIFFLYFLIGITQNHFYLFLILPLIFIIVDGVYVAIFRFGKEHTW